MHSATNMPLNRIISEGKADFRRAAAMYVGWLNTAGLKTRNSCRCTATRRNNPTHIYKHGYKRIYYIIRIK